MYNNNTSLRTRQRRVWQSLFKEGLQIGIKRTAATVIQNEKTFIISIVRWPGKMRACVRRWAALIFALIFSWFVLFYQEKRMNKKAQDSE